MAYYFAVETEESSYRAINIRNSKKFGAEYNTKEPYVCTLTEIDDFTTSFKDETSLKEELLKEEIIKQENMNQNLAIILKLEDEIKIISKDIIYEDSKTILEQPELIIKYINSKAEELDYNFFRQIYEQEKENTVTKSLAANISTIIEKNNNSELNIETKQMIEEFAKLLIYHTKTNQNGIVTYRDKINKESLHNIIVFINKYEQSLVKPKTKKHINN